MLDQNTDRMWYVIGAVIVGAALILLMNGTFPELFASVGETFKDKTEDVKEITDGIMPVRKVNENMIEYREIGVDSWNKNGITLQDFDEATGTWTLNLTPDMIWHDGLRTISKENIVPYGESYTISYEVWTPVTLNTNNDINSYPVTGSNNWADSLNDSDNLAKRAFSNTTAKAGEWTKMWITYTNDDPGNVNKVGLYDQSTFGLYNTTDETVQIKIRRVKGELSDYPTPYSLAPADQ